MRMCVTPNRAESLLSRGAGKGFKHLEVYKQAEALSYLRPHQADLIYGFSCLRGGCWRVVLVTDN